MEFIVIAALFTILLALFKFKFFLPRSSSGNKTSAQENNEKKSTRFCPLCNSLLEKGENVKSKVYPSNTSDTLMDIIGCKKCMPPNGTEDRICPVCKKKLPPDGFVTGRYFIRPNKKHLHVLGCTLCRKIK